MTRWLNIRLNPIRVAVAFTVLATVTALSGMAFRNAQNPRLLGQLPVYVDASRTPTWPRDVSSAPVVPAFTLLDQNARAVNERDLNGHLTVLTFFYASCDSICPRLHAQLRMLREQLTDTLRVRFLSVSLLPEHDTPEVLTTFAHHERLQNGWTLLTGSREQVDRVMGAPVYARTVRTGESIRAHGEAVYLLDASRRVRGIYHGTQGNDIAQLQADIATLNGVVNATPDAR